MAYDTWAWALTEDAQGAGYPQRFQPIRTDPRLGQRVEAGYSPTRPKYTKAYWIFNVGWSTLHPSGYIYLVDFFDDHRGGIPFYFTWPVGLYGIPPQLYFADPGGLSPWSSEVEPGFGESPTYLCQFDMDELGAERVEGVSNNYWQLEVKLRSL
jgi:hypothetical protein